MMIYYSAGQTEQIYLTEKSKVRIESSGIVGTLTLTPKVGTPQVISLTNVPYLTELNDFEDGTVLTVRVVSGLGSCGVEVDGNAPQLAEDQSGNVSGLVKKNGDKIGLINHPYAANSSTVLMGDSLMAFGIGATRGTQTNSHVGWCNEYFMASGLGWFDIVDNFSASGHTLDNVIATQLPSALASTAEIAWLHIGVNNLNNALGSNNPVSTILSKFSTIIAALAADKKVVIVDSINPLLQTGSTNARQRAFTIPTVNAGIARLCSQYSNVIYNDTYSVMVDTTSAFLNPKANMVDPSDGIHFVSIGAQTAGYASFVNLSSKVKISRYKTPGANLLPTFSGTGGTVTGGGFITVTGTPPVGWELQGLSGVAATHSVTISTLAPDYIRLVFSNTGPSAATTYLLVNNMQSTITRNTLVQGGFGFQCSGNVGLNRIAVSLRVNGSGADGDIISGMGQGGEPTITYPQIAHGGLRYTPPFLIRDIALSNFEFIIAFNIAATSGASTIDLYAPELVRLT